MDRTITDLTKFICCILIIIHHVCLGSTLTTPIGTIACSIFFFISAYGITVSQLNKPLQFLGFVKRRLSKIYLPLLFVNVLSIAMASIFSNHGLAIPVFGIGKTIAMGGGTLKDLIFNVLGIIKIDSVTWFLDYLFISYICIWVMCRMKALFHILAAIGLVAMVNVLYFIHCSAPFWEILDVLGLYGGFLYARFGHKLPTQLFSNKSTCFTFLIFLLTYILWVKYQDGMMFRYSFALMILYDISALLVVIGISINVHMCGRGAIIISKLSVLSYFIYLIHMKVIDVLYSVYGLDNILVSITVTVLTACFVQFLYNCIHDNIVK